MIDWQYCPKSDPPPHHLRALLSVFEAAEPVIQSRPNDDSGPLSSNKVPSILAGPLIEPGHLVEAGKRAEDKISGPLLFGRNGLVEKALEADAYHRDDRTVLEAEAGRAVVNNAVLKDLFEAYMTHDVD